MPATTEELRELSKEEGEISKLEEIKKLISHENISLRITGYSKINDFFQRLASDLKLTYDPNDVAALLKKASLKYSSDRNSNKPKDLQDIGDEYLKLIREIAGYLKRRQDTAPLIPNEIPSNQISQENTKRKYELLIELLRQKKICEIWSDNAISDLEYAIVRESEANANEAELDNKIDITLKDGTVINFSRDNFLVTNLNSGLEIKINFKDGELWKVAGFDFDDSDVGKKKQQIFNQIERRIEGLKSQNEINKNGKKDIFRLSKIEALSNKLNVMFGNYVGKAWLGSKDSFVLIFIERCSMEEEYLDGDLTKKKERDVFTFELSDGRSLKLQRDKWGKFFIKDGSEEDNKYKPCEENDFTNLENLLNASVATPYLLATQEEFDSQLELSNQYADFFTQADFDLEVEYINRDGEAFVKRDSLGCGNATSFERYKIGEKRKKENLVTYSFDHLGRLVSDSTNANSVITQEIFDRENKILGELSEFKTKKEAFQIIADGKLIAKISGDAKGGGKKEDRFYQLLELSGIEKKYSLIQVKENGAVAKNTTSFEITIDSSGNPEIQKIGKDGKPMPENEKRQKEFDAIFSALQKSGQGSTTSGQSEFGLSQKDFETFSELGITVSFESKLGETKVSYKCSKELDNTYSLVQQFHRPDSNHPKFIVDFNADPKKPKITREPWGLFASKPDQQFQNITRAFSQKLRSPIFDDDEMDAVIEKFESLFGDQNPCDVLIADKSDHNWLESRIWKEEQDGNYYFLSSKQECVRLNLDKNKLEVFHKHDDCGNLIFRECNSNDAEIIYDFKVTIAGAEKIEDIYKNDFDFDDNSSEADSSSVSSDNSSSNGSDDAHSESSESYNYGDVQSSSNQKPSQFNPQVTKQIYPSITTDEVVGKLFGENLKKQKQDIGRRKAFTGAAEVKDSIKAIDLLIDSVSQDEIFDNKLKRALVKVDSDLKKSQVRTHEDAINLWMNDLSSLDKKVLITAYNYKNPTSTISEGLADKRNIKTRITTSKSNTKIGIEKNISEDAVLAKLDVKTSSELKEAKEISPEDENGIINVLVSAAQLLNNWKQGKENIPQEFEAFKKQQADQIYGRPGTSISVTNVKRFLALKQPQSRS